MNNNKKELTKKFLHSLKTAVMSSNANSLSDTVLEDLYTDLLNVSGEGELPDSTFIPIPIEFTSFEIQILNDEQMGISMPPVQMPKSAKEFESTDIKLEFCFENEGETLSEFPLSIFANIDSTKQEQVEFFENIENNVVNYIFENSELIAVANFGEDFLLVILKEGEKTNAYLLISSKLISHIGIKNINYVKIVSEGENPENPEDPGNLNL